METVNIPKVSILIPCFNHEKYLLECLNSLLLAYSGELEIIICDDGSKDNSIKIINNFITHNKLKGISFTFLKHTENKGVSATLNECLNYTSSEYIYIIASDDYLVPGGLTTAIDVMKSNDVDAVISDCNVVDDKGSMVSDSAFFKYRSSSPKRIIKNLPEELVFNWVVPGPSLLLKRSVYDKIGYYDEDLMAEDRDFYLRLTSKVKVFFNSKIIANYRVHNSNFSKSNIYLDKRNHEFAIVNYRASGLYTGLAAWYLSSYKMDILGLHKLPRALRKILRVAYILTH
ncbi:glycosyltransferase [Pseudescherichia sp.]|uniref:glycosyltransferase family 2 protein n=1 Tax=Pseudescherichia sp. TaxID=2055881 RepID=UPI002899067F|nr:glycosyltransferase [Pseudescherichia sp.]